MTDPLERLLVKEGRQMDEQLVGHLRRSLAPIIERWLSNEIERGNWEVQEYPHTGPATLYLMAAAAIMVLQAIYDAETELVHEGWLDADAAILPDGVDIVE